MTVFPGQSQYSLKDSIIYDRRSILAHADALTNKAAAAGENNTEKKKEKHKSKKSRQKKPTIDAFSVQSLKPIRIRKSDY